MDIKSKEELNVEMLTKLMDDIVIAQRRNHENSNKAVEAKDEAEVHRLEQVMHGLTNLHIALERLQDLWKDPMHTITEDEYWLYKSSVNELNSLV